LSDIGVSKPAAITFDLWQTLIFEEDGSAKSNIRRKLRAQYSMQELALLDETVSPELAGRLFHELSDEITAGHDQGLDFEYDEWILKLFERMSPGVEGRVGTDEVLRVGRVIDRTFIDAPPLLLEGSAAVLDELAGKGLKVGLISNTGLTSPEMYREWFGQLGIVDKFDSLVFSNEQRVAKPSPEIFETALAKLGVEATRALHIGDNLHTDVGGAAAVGMSTVWVRGGTNSPVISNTEPDYTVDSILELPRIVDEWMALLED
jgi:FMN phosphatase YigB (HAD superfamily)